MKIDDKKLEEGRKKMEQRIKRADTLTLSVVKGHRAIEMAIDETLATFGADKNGGFSAKANRCEELIQGSEAAQNWKVLWAADSLRNELAHSRDSIKIDAKMAKLRQEYMQSLSPQQAEGLKTVDDETVAHQACVSVAGFLYAQRETKKREV
jgi:hypothetical protein